MLRLRLFEPLFEVLPFSDPPLFLDKLRRVLLSAEGLSLGRPVLASALWGPLSLVLSRGFFLIVGEVIVPCSVTRAFWKWKLMSPRHSVSLQKGQACL